MNFKSSMVKALVIALLGTVSTESLADEGNNELTQRLLTTTQARTKLVWQRRVDNDPNARGHESSQDDQQMLVVFDTDEHEERVLLPGPVSAYRPIILPDGSGVVYTDMTERASYYIDWEGNEKRQLATGELYMALSAWQDPETGKHWVLIGDGAYRGPHNTPLYRVRLDDPEVRELLWDKTPVGRSLFLSADGTRLGGEFPWPRTGVADLATGEWLAHGGGCFPIFAPDNSYRFAHCGGGHRGLRMFDAGATGRRDVPTSGYPGDTGSGETWHPRWSNDVRFLTIIAPSHQVSNPNIFLGRFDRNFTRIEAWVEVTSDATSDTNPHAWIEPAPDRAAMEALETRLAEILQEDDLTEAIEQLRRTAQNEQNEEGKNAAELLEAFENWCRGNLAVGSVLETQDTDEAIRLYTALSERLQGLEHGREAAERLERLDTKWATARQRLRELAAQWPANRDGLIFRYATADDPITALGTDGQQIAAFDLTARGRARTNRYGQLILDGGGRFEAEAEGVGEYLAEACRQSGALTIQAYVNPAIGLPQGEIVSFGSTAADGNFALARDGYNLTVSLNTSSGGAGWIPVLSIPTGPFHITVTYDNGKLRSYLNGQEPMQARGGEPAPQRSPIAELLDGDFSNWEPARLVLGDEPEGRSSWLGLLEGVAIFDRALSAEEVRRDAEAYLKMVEARNDLKPVPVVRLKAKLVARSDTPTLQQMEPYTRALAVHQYEVEEVHFGEIESETVLVARWVVMDGREMSAANETLGGSRVMTLEPFEAHGQLASEYLSDTLEEFDGLFYDVSGELFQ